MGREGRGSPRGLAVGQEPSLDPLSAPGSPAGALPGRPGDILLLERHGNTSLCVLEPGACTPLASFTSTVSAGAPCPGDRGTAAQPAHPVLVLQGLGRPGLLEQELRRDVAMGQCRQVSAGSREDTSPVCDVSPACDRSLCPQIWHHENSTAITLWACPMHKCECPWLCQGSLGLVGAVGAPWTLSLPHRPACPLGAGMDGGAAGSCLPPAPAPAEEGGH